MEIDEMNECEIPRIRFKPTLRMEKTRGTTNNGLDVTLDSVLPVTIGKG
jgi:hypothetical protein